MIDVLCRARVPRGCGAASLTFATVMATVALAACTADPPESAPPALAPPAAGATRGELVQYTATFDDGRTEDQYFLRVGDAERRLLFDAEPGPDFTGGTIIDVWGLPE